MSGKPIDAEDIAVLLRLQAALPNVGLNGWFEGVRVLARVIEHLAAAQQQGQAVAECHCATCTCAPGMTPAVRFDTSPAAQEGAVRDHLIALGWTPPGAHQTAAVGGDFINRIADSLIAKGWDIDPNCDGTGVAQLREAVISAIAQQPADVVVDDTRGRAK